MERSEPTLVPEWLRSTGSVTGGGSSAHHLLSSSSHSEVTSQAHHTRNRTSKIINDIDKSHSSFLERISPSNPRRSLSNGSGKHAYSNFNRNHREKDRLKERERSSFGDHWDHDGTDPLGNIFSSRVDKETLRRSHSMVTRKPADLFPRKVSTDSKSSVNSNHHNGNDILSGISISGFQKAVFDQDFPSLGSEDKQGVPDIGRVSSPILSTAVQSLPVGNSALIGGEGWTSALAEVPTVIGGSSTGSSSVQHTVAVTPGPGPSGAVTGLNMAEALVQVPSRARTAPQVSVKTQRLEELAIKQSRQLIPVTPSIPKASALNSDKSKPKTPSRTGDLNVTAKNGPHQPSSMHYPNQTFRGAHVKSDSPKTSHGKFHVLKPVWENGVAPPKDVFSSPTSNVNPRAVNSQLAVAPSVAPAATSRSPNNLSSSSMERKLAALDLKSGPTLEKRSSMSQVQSRNDFFNLIKKKTSMNVPPTSQDLGPVLSLTVEKSGDSTRNVVSAPSAPYTIQNSAEVTSNGEIAEEVKGFSNVRDKSMSTEAEVYPDEEEAAFLRSLGWEENSGEDEGLTEEEINAFYQEYMTLKPSLKVCRGMQPKLSILSESHGANLGGASSELNSSNSRS